MNRVTVGLVVGAVALVSLSCSSDKTTSAPSATDPASTSTTTIASPLAKGNTYVALGSSIASGFGISVQSATCGRSTRSYPSLIADRYELALTDVSCGAARIPNVVDTPQGTNPVQLTAVTPDTKLITISVGGNDIGYNATAIACGDPESVCSAPPTYDADLTTARAVLAAMVDRIRAAAPEATIVFVTYPREVPEGNCPALSYTVAEAGLVRSMGEDLEAMFVDVVGADDDVVFVDPYVEGGDHTGCAPEAGRWAAGYVADDGTPFHPTALGHEVMAQMIADALGG